MNNKLYSIKKLGFSIDWTLIEITKSEVIQYCYTLLEHKTTYEKTVVELICEKDNDANFKKLVSKLISYDKTVDIDICLRKWRALYSGISCLILPLITCKIYLRSMSFGLKWDFQKTSIIFTLAQKILVYILPL